MSTTARTARGIAFRRDSGPQAPSPVGRAMRLLRAALAPFGCRRLPRSIHAAPLSEHLRRDIGLDPPAGTHFLASRSHRWP